eukprot:4820464-Amphidinium_carterae.1
MTLLGFAVIPLPMNGARGQLLLLVTWRSLRISASGYMIVFFVPSAATQISFTPMLFHSRMPL